MGRPRLDMTRDESFYQEILSRLVQLGNAATPFEGVTYRSSTPRYATEHDLLTGLGSRQEGGRWNPKGITVVYTSLCPETALTETLAHFRYYGLSIEDAMPRTFVAIVAKLQAVLDLRQGAIRQRLRVSRNRMLREDWRGEMRLGRKPITQTIGQAALQSGWEGLLVPSAADQAGSNLLVFPDNLRRDSLIRIHNAERLGT